MAVDLRQSSPVSFRRPSQEHYSYAAEHALSEREPSLEELEAAVKETPPRPSSTLINGHLRNSSEPRSFGDVMDEGEKMLPPGSPSLRHTKGRLEHDIRPKSPQESYASAVKHEAENTSNTHGISGSDSIKEENEDESANGIDSSHVRHESSVKQKLLDARKNASKDDEHESFADIVKHHMTDQDTEHRGSIKQETDETKHSTQRSEQSHQHLSFPDIPQNEPVKKESPTLPASFPNPPQNTFVKQEDSDHEIKLPDLPEHEPTSSSDTYANIVKHEPTSPIPRPESASSATKTIVGESETPKTATSNRNVAALSSEQQESTDESRNGVLMDGDDSTYGTQDGNNQDNADDTKPGSLIYENYESRSGTNLASIALGKEYELAMSQRENKQIPTNSSAEKSNGSKLVSGRRAGAGWSRSAVRWAPLNVPVQRRLQTLAVLAHSLSIASFVAVFFFLCAIPIFWPVLLPYLIYILLSSAGTDGKLAHRSEFIRKSKFWSAFASYFPARLHRSVELEPNRKYIFGYHPHGIISHGAFAAFATEALGFGSLFPGITNTLLTLDSNFRIPFYRDWILRLGLASVARESCENLLSRGGRNGEGMGRAITIVIGGARESLDAKPGTLNLVLAKRKGFVKLAVRTGADLVPVLAFGENDMYDQISSETHPWIHKWQLLVKRCMGFTLPLFHARGIFNYDVGIMPYRRPINIVVGHPIKTKMSKKPDPAYVDELHKQYTDELLNLWEEWKDTFAPDRKEELQIVE